MPAARLAPSHGETTMSSTTLTATRCHKPNTCGCVERLGHVACVRITDAKAKTEFYVVSEMDGQEEGVRGFEITKLVEGLPTGEGYQVHLVDADGLSENHCTCPGGVYTGKCKHAKALRALIGRGAL